VQHDFTPVGQEAKWRRWSTPKQLQGNVEEFLWTLCQ
jgi:hypothetical protein